MNKITTVEEGVKAFFAYHKKDVPVYTVTEGKKYKSITFDGKTIPLLSYEEHPKIRGIFAKREILGSPCALTDHPHIFDMMRYILDDEVSEVYAETAPNMRNAEVEDFAFVTGITKKGTLFSLDPSYSRTENPAKVISDGWEQYPKRVEVNMSAYGDEGYVIGDVYGNWIHHTGLPNHNYTSFPCGHRYGKHNMIDNFYNSIRFGDKPAITLEYHRKTIEIVDAAYRSIYEGKPIKLL